MSVTVYKYDGVKMAAVSSYDETAWTKDNDKDSEVAEMSKRVAWLYAVHGKRAGAAAGLPIELLRNGEAIEVKDYPIDIDIKDLLYRYSLVMDMYGENYMFKVEQGKQVVEVRWFSPSTITIEQNKTGLVGFTRTLGNEKRYYPVKDNDSRVMWTWLPGDVEIGPGNPPVSSAEDAAMILRHAGKTTRTYFERGAIDNWAIFDDRLYSLGDADRKRFRASWNRMFRAGWRKMGEILHLGSGAEMQRINSPIAEQVLPELDELQANAICIAHQTPLLLMSPRTASNRSVIDQATLTWTNAVIIPHAEMMLKTLNRQLFHDMGYEWIVNAESMNVNQEEEVLKQQAYSGYVASGMPPETAAAMLGLDVPEGMPLVIDEPIAEPEQPQPVMIEEETKSVAWHDDKRRLKTWLKNDSARDIDDFNSNELSHLDKLDTYTEVFSADVYNWRNYP